MCPDEHWLMRTQRPHTSLLSLSAQWAIRFDAQRTKLEDFHVDETTTVQVPMMVEGNEKKWYLQDNHVPCSVLRLDYQDDAKVLLILPDPAKWRRWKLL